MPRVQLDESFEPGTGLPDDFAATVNQAAFEFDARYNEGKTLLLKLKVQPDDPSIEVAEIAFSCGDGWTSPDGGRTAVSTKGKKKFNQNSMYYKLIDRCVAETKDGGLDLSSLFAARGAKANEARLWEGLKFHFRREKVEFGPRIDPVEHLMPVKFLGEVFRPGPQGQTLPASAPVPAGAAVPTQTVGAPSVQVSAPGVQASASAPPPAGVPVPATASAPAGAPPAALPLKVRLIQAAQRAQSVLAFQSEVTTWPEVLNDEKLLYDVLDEGPSGFYARVKAGNA